MTVRQGAAVREDTGEVVADGVVVGQVRRVPRPFPNRPLWRFSYMNLAAGRLVEGRGVYAARADAVLAVLSETGRVRVEEARRVAERRLTGEIVLCSTCAGDADGYRLSGYLDGPGACERCGTRGRVSNDLMEFVPVGEGLPNSE